MNAKVQKVITLEPEELFAFCGQGDAKLRQIQDLVDARIIARGNEIRISGTGADADKAFSLIKDLLEVQRTKKQGMSEHEIKIAARHYQEAAPGDMKEVFIESIPVPLRRRQVAPLTPNQKRYVDAIRKEDIVFAVGPAGTGKTYLAVAMAVASLIEGQVGRIILVRPAVEAGEKLGFLPGDIEAKFNPFVRPLYDALYEMIDAEKIRAYLDNGTIEIAPLAFMRGRTLNNSFIILDEAQNTSVEQMKMFLTRLGFDSRAVITGDITQVDLPQGKSSGLIHVRKILKNIQGISFVEFTGKDVVRHTLVQKIIQAYEKHG